MSTKISNLKDSSNNTVYPVTKANAVYKDDNTTVEAFLANPTFTNVKIGNCKIYYDSAAKCLKFIFEE